MDNIFIPANKSERALKHYVAQHLTMTKKTARGAFYRVVEPMHVFKKVYHNDGDPLTLGEGAIANLIIPKGATVYFRSVDGKMRTSRAHVHSIVAYKGHTWSSLRNLFTYHVSSSYIPSDLAPACLVSVSTARSEFDGTFKYETGKTIKPFKRFSHTDEHCASGIHFFLNIREALAY
jgi:hypothetical protein